MGANSYESREQAMAAIVELGRSTAAALEQRLAVESDPEIRHRLRYVLAAILPPDQAVLIIRAWADCGLKPGDVLTHIDHRRIRRPSDLARLAGNRARGRRLRIRGPDRPRYLNEFQLGAVLDGCGERGPAGGERVHRGPEQVMKGAAQQSALVAGGKQGLRTALVKRPVQRGVNGKGDLTPDPSFDYVGDDFRDRAAQLGV